MNIICPHCGQPYELSDESPRESTYYCTRCEKKFSLLPPERKDDRPAQSGSDRFAALIGYAKLTAGLIGLAAAAGIVGLFSKLDEPWIPAAGLVLGAMFSILCCFYFALKLDAARALEARQDYICDLLENILKKPE